MSCTYIIYLLSFFSYFGFEKRNFSSCFNWLEIDLTVSISLFSKFIDVTLTFFYTINDNSNIFVFNIYVIWYFLNSRLIYWIFFICLKIFIRLLVMTEFFFILYTYLYIHFSNLIFSFVKGGFFTVLVDCSDLLRWFTNFFQSMIEKC